MVSVNRVGNGLASGEDVLQAMVSSAASSESTAAFGDGTMLLGDIRVLSPVVPEASLRRPKPGRVVLVKAVAQRSRRKQLVRH